MAKDEPCIAVQRDRLEGLLLAGIDGLVINGDRECRLSHNLHVSVPDVPNDVVIARLRHGVALSTGAACSSGAHTPSHVLRAMGVSEAMQEGACAWALESSPLTKILSGPPRLSSRR
jgi:cysteine desulfurase